MNATFVDRRVNTAKVSEFLYVNTQHSSLFSRKISKWDFTWHMRLPASKHPLCKCLLHLRHCGHCRQWEHSPESVFMAQFQHGVVGDENCMSTTDVGYYYVH